jgi:hypothetical protein
MALSRVAVAAAALAALVACGGGGSSGGETGACQGSSFAGGDPAADADGDGLSNGAECPIGTNPLAADTDGDGLLDGDVVAKGTLPRVADPDGDGLADGAEGAGGSSPLVPDTDGDGLLDGDEVAAGTSPLAADTDDDGLLDGDEAAAGTSPLAADTDGDGLLDGDEIALGLVPTVADPPTAALCDVLRACARSVLVPVLWEDQLDGDYRLALPADAVVGELFFLDSPPPGRLAATGFDLASPSVAGFVLSMDEPVQNGDPGAQLGALAGRLAAAAGQAGVPWTATELVAGRAVQSWDGFPAVVGARVNLTGAAGNAGAVRQAVLARMAGLGDVPYAGLPPGAFGTGPFVVSLEVLSRRNGQGDAHRVVVVAAVAPKSWFDDRTQATRIVAADLAGGTALGQSGDGEGRRCDAIPVAGDPRADFVWMSDISGSTDDERDPIRENAAAVFGRLDTLGIDFRMGVVQHTSNSVTRPTEGQHGQLLSPGFTRAQATFEGWWSLAGGDGLEYGLTAIDDVVGPGGTALPRTATEQATKVREGVKLVVVYVSDEHPQELEDACSLVRDFCNEQNDPDYPCPDLTGDACVASVIQPFVANLAAQEAIAFGIIAPPPNGCTTSQEVGWGYAETIAALGGSYGSVCASDPGQTLDDIVSAVAGAASSFQLPATPIAMTLKVVVTGAAAPACNPANPGPGRRDVPRSQVDGFDYDPVSNTIFFVGPNRPAAGDTVTVSYREWEDRTVDPNPDPLPCDCGGCEQGYFCEPNLCACILIPG